MKSRDSGQSECNLRTSGEKDLNCCQLLKYRHL